MACGRKIVAWGGGLALGLILIGLGIYLLRLGLEKAAAIATVLGAFTGVIGLAVAIVTLAVTRSDQHRSGDGAPKMRIKRAGTVIGEADNVNINIDGRR